VLRRMRKCLAIMVTIVFLLTQALAGTALAVYDLRPVVITENSVDLEWSIDTAEPITGLYYKPSASTTWLNAPTPIDAYSVSASVYGLSPGINYDFKVTSIYNESQTTVTTGVGGGDTTAPYWDQGGGLSAITESNLTSTSVTLSWTPALDNVGVTGYKISYNGIEMSVAGNVYNITGLTPGTYYNFQISARDANNNWSSPPLYYSVVTLTASSPQWPQGTSLAYTNLTSTSLTLNWPTAISGVGIYRYKILKNGEILDTTNSSTVSYSVYGLTPGCNYNFAVRAEDNMGYTTPDLSKIVTTPDGVSQTSAGQLYISPGQGIAGQPTDIILTYQPSETMANGTLVFNLPSTIATPEDTWYLSGQSPSPIGAGAISDGGRTVTITNLNVVSVPIILTLGNKTFPSEGIYAFSAISDADGTGLKTASPGTGNESGTFVVATSNNADLSGLILNNGVLAPAFAAGITSYTASVANNITTITATPITADIAATVCVNGVEVPSGLTSGVISLNEGDNIVAVQVTAQNGTTKTYTIIVKKAPLTTLSEGNTTVAVNSEPVNISVPAGVSNARVAVTTAVEGSNKVATVPQIEVSAATSLGAISLAIPAGTRFTGPSGWDGTIQLPTVLANNTVSLSSGGTVNAVVEVGFGDVELTFDKAVRLLLPGMAGKTAGYTRGGNPVTQITRVISADTRAAADNEIPAGGEGKIDAGPDQVIWTKHFTEFVAYTPADGGGGGVGGAMTTPSGTLEITPYSGSPGQVQNISLTYDPGDMLTSGTVVFQLPSGFSAVQSDTCSIGGGVTTQIGAGAIGNEGQTVTLTGLTMSVGTVVLNLNNKTLPSAGSYVFSARADSDGPGTAYTSSPGTGDEIKTFNVVDQLTLPVWRYDTGTTPPTEPQYFTPFEYNGSTNTLTLFWKKVLDNGSPVSAYKIYRALDSVESNWYDPAIWGTEILTIPEPTTTFTAPNNVTFLAFSDNALLSGTSPGTEYRFGIRAVNGDKISNISNIPYPFHTPEDTPLGIDRFILIPEYYTTGKYALGIGFTSPVDISKAVDISRYAVTLDGSPVSLKGPDGGKGYYNYTRNSVMVDTGISTGLIDGQIVITATGITDQQNNTMNTNEELGPYNVISGQIYDNIGGETEGAVKVINPLGGNRSEYLFVYQTKEAIPQAGQIKVAFPAEYSLDNLISAPNTSSRPFDPNGDINMDGAGVVTIGSVNVNTSTREVTLNLTGAVAAGDFLAFVLDNITNPVPSSDAQSYMIKVMSPAASLNSITLPAFIEKSGTVTVVVNNLPSNAGALVFAEKSDFYKETSTSSPATGDSRQFTLNVKIPGEYNIGVRPVNESDFMPPPTKLVSVTGSTTVTINIQDAYEVTFELKDEQGVVPANGSVYAYAPSNPDVTGTRGQIDPATGRVTLKLKTGFGYIVGGDAPGLPSASERTIYVDTGGSVYVDGGTTSVEVVGLTIKKPARTITGTIRYSDGSPVIGAPVYARSNKYPAGTPPAYTDNNGGYSLFVPQDIWTVEVFIPQIGARVVTSSANTKANATVTADLNLPPLISFAKVTGTVLAGGNPVQGATVWAEASNKKYLNGVVTGPDGKYTLQFDSSKTDGATIHCSSPEFGELAPQPYGATVNFSISTGTLNISFGRNVTGTVSIYQSGSSNRRISGEMKNSSSISLKAPTGVYTVEVYINEIGRITKESITLPGTLNLSAEVAAASTLSLNVTVTNGGSDAWVNVIGIEQGKTIAQGKRTTGGTATFIVPQNTELSVNVSREGYFPAKQDVKVKTTNTAVNFTLNQEILDNAVTVTLTGSEEATGKSEYYVWAKDVSSGSVVKSRSTGPNDIVVKLPSSGSWIFKASTEGYFSDEVTITVLGAGTMQLPLSNMVETKTATAVVKSNEGGTVSSQEVGVKLVIPANALGNTGTNASITTSTTLAVTETSTAKPMGSARDITITDNEGKVTTLSRSIEIILDYHSDYLTWPAGQRDQMALQMQLAYWDAGVDDWVVIPSTNDVVNHTIRGFVDHLTKFAVVYPQTLVIRGMASQPAQSSISVGTPSVDKGISDSSLNDAIAAAGATGKVVLAVATGSREFDLTLEQLNRVETVAKPVEVKISGVNFNFNAEVLKSPDLNVSQVKSFILGAQKISEGTAGGAGGSVLYKVSGGIFQLNVRAKMANNTEQDIKQFNGKMVVSLPVSADSREAAEKGNLFAGRLNEATNSWDEVSGKYDATSGTYIFETDRFSKWALLEKISISVKTFSDIYSHWARTDIEYMATNGYISGMGGGLYSPDASVTRAQFATMLVNVLKPDGKAEVPFGDVRPGEWYYLSVGRAYAAGLVKGDGNVFAPEELITREQMAAMICNALKYKGLLAEVNDLEGTLRGFADQPSISGWARKSSAQAVKHGILRGKPSGGQIYFAPADKATRAEAAVMLKNLVGQMK